MAADGITIRPAVPDDAATLAGHRVAMLREMQRYEPAAVEEMLPAFKEWFEESLADGSFRAWLAEDEEEGILGGAGVLLSVWPPIPVERKPLRLTVLNVYTEPFARERGVARRLMNTVLDFCRGAGFRRVFLHATDMGRPLYESLGFKATGNEMVLRDEGS